MWIIWGEGTLHVTHPSPLKIIGGRQAPLAPPVPTPIDVICFYVLVMYLSIRTMYNYMARCQARQLSGGLGSKIITYYSGDLIIRTQTIEHKNM